MKGNKMGLLDAAMGMLDSAIGSDQNQDGDIKAKLIQAVIGMLASKAQDAGLQNLMSAFQNADLGDIINSWVENGENLPISAEQIMKALGGGQLGQLAQSAGVTEGQAASGLADLLPSLINQMTPNGQAGDAADFNPAQLIGQLTSLFGK
jgi:uncharacterized protein YidB (DUF937 family)